MRKKDPTTCSHAIRPPFGMASAGDGSGFVSLTASSEPLAVGVSSFFSLSIPAIASIPSLAFCDAKDGIDY